MCIESTCYSFTVFKSLPFNSLSYLNWQIDVGEVLVKLIRYLLMSALRHLLKICGINHVLACRSGAFLLIVTINSLKPISLASGHKNRKSIKFARNLIKFLCCLF